MTGGGDIYIYAQTVHQKPIIGGYVSREPSYTLETLYRSPFLKATTRSSHEESSKLPLTKEGYKDMPRTLELLNTGYVILHKSLLEPEELVRVIKWIEPGIGRPVFEDSWIIIYSLL